MKTLYLLAKEIQSGIEEFFEKHDLVQLYLIILALAYITAFLSISTVWYVYELIQFGHLIENKKDTYTALIWSLLLMLPIVDVYLLVLNKKLRNSSNQGSKNIHKDASHPTMVNTKKQNGESKNREE